VALARSVPQNNDRRSAIKQRVNDLTGSALGEIKSSSPGQEGRQEENHGTHG
jgi:hypothetical protein